MGTWDTGILDNDAALDGLGDITHAVMEGVRSLGEALPEAEKAGELAAGIGLLLQLSPFDFSPQSSTAATISETLETWAQVIEATLSPEAQAVLSQVAQGEGEALAKRPAELPEAIVSALHNGAAAAPYGQREAALFETPAGAAFMKRITAKCTDMIEADFEHEDVWADLCRDATGMAVLAMLLVLEPCKVDPKRIAHWRACSAKGLKMCEAAEHEELEFQRPYYANLDRVFAALEQRYG